eukprot:1350956-Rhodomonas_salina.1
MQSNNNNDPQAAERALLGAPQYPNPAGDSAVPTMMYNGAPSPPAAVEPPAPPHVRPPHHGNRGHKPMQPAAATSHFYTAALVQSLLPIAFSTVAFVAYAKAT